MKIFTCIDHDYKCPVGCASVIIAKNEKEAQQMLDDVLIGDDLKPFSQQSQLAKEPDWASIFPIILLQISIMAIFACFPNRAKQCSKSGCP